MTVKMFSEKNLESEFRFAKSPFELSERIAQVFKK